MMPKHREIEFHMENGEILKWDCIGSWYDNGEIGTDGIHGPEFYFMQKEIKHEGKPSSLEQISIRKDKVVAIRELESFVEEKKS